MLASVLAHLSLLLNSPPTVPPHLSRRAALSSAAAAALAASSTAPAFARPEGVNKPELLPSGPTTNVIQMAEQKYLTTGQAKALDDKLTKLETATGIKVRVLCQQYPNTPGLAIKDYWGLDDKSIVMIVDKGAKGTANALNFNVADGLKFNLPNQFWTRLQSTFGNTFFIRENGEDVAILRAIDTISYCVSQEDAFCVDVPPQFKDPSKAMYGAQDPATKLLGEKPGKDIFEGFSKKTANIFGE